MPVSFSTQDDVAEVEGREQLGDERGVAAQRQVRARAHRDPVGAPGQGRDDAAVVGAEVVDDRAPERGPDGQAADEDDDRAVAPGVRHLDRPRRQLDRARPVDRAASEPVAMAAPR